MVTIKRKDLLELFAGMNATAELEGSEFAYAVAVNIKKIQPEIDAINAMLKPSEDFSKFTESRDQIVKKYGTPMSDGNRYTIPQESMAAYEEEIKTVEEECKDILKKREELEKEYVEFLEKESSVDLCMVAKSDIPKSITPRQVFAILPMIVQ